MMEMQGINPNIDRRGSSSTSNPDGEMVRADNGEAINIWTLEFRDDEHAYDWYNRYAISAGFSIRRHAGFKNKEKGYYTSRSFVCSKEGLRKEKEQDVPAKKERWNTRCGCLASFTIQRQSSGKYFTFDWCAQHNHELATPTKAHLLRSHRRINKLQHHECDNADIANIPLKLANDLRAAQVGGKEHLKIDLKHHLSNRRSKSMGVGVACALLNWFGDPHRNSQFFFRVMLDDDEQISNVFWCDRSMQNDFALFWDFVLFDTTYMTNSEHRPLGAFLGVNNHRELVVFGACLLFDETIQSFKWLFETFVECMEGKTPQSLFTDQDAEMLAAIPTALPDTHHFLCVWQINQYALKNLGSLFDNRDFKKDWNKLLFDNDVDDFDLVWCKMIDDYDLHDNEWLQHIYEKREKWAPTYVQSVFCAGKRTRQLSNNFNTTLRRYLKTTMNMAQFLQHFKQAIIDMRHKELRMNFDMQDKLSTLRFKDPLCIHASEVYTPNILNLFVEQTEKSYWIALNCQRESVGSEEVEVHVCSHDPTHNCKTAKRHVITTINEFHQCSCKYFNFVGIICSHIIWLLKRKNPCFFIPEKYILRRWTRKPMMIATSESASNIKLDSNSERAINRKKYADLYASTIMKYGDAPKSWDVLQRHYVALASNLIPLTREPCEIGKPADAPRADGALVTIAKQEPKHQSNKQVKSTLEQSKKSLNGLKSGSATSSQPVACHLQLEDEPDVLNED